MALGDHRTILQVVGYQNSGKTTLIEKLIARSKQLGLKTATIKHHGHGGKPAFGTKAKDSERHFAAGAVLAGVEGDGMLNLSANIRDWSLQQLIDFYQLFGFDILFIEGYKTADYPKAVIIRNKEDLHLLNALTQIQCVISYIKLKQNEFPHLKIFHIDQDHLYIDYLLKVAVKKLGTNII